MVDYLFSVFIFFAGKQAPGLSDVSDRGHYGELHFVVLAKALHCIGDNPPDMTFPATLGDLLYYGIIMAVVIMLLTVLLQTKLSLSLEQQAEELFHIDMNVITVLTLIDMRQ